MGIILGSVPFGGFIAPTDSTDTYATHDELYNRGGYRTVVDIASRDLITPDRRKIGMLVYVTADDKYYTLKTGLLNADWEDATMGGGGRTALFINDNVTNNYRVLPSDRLIHVRNFGDGAMLELEIHQNDFEEGYVLTVINDNRNGDTGNGGSGNFIIHGYDGASFRKHTTSGTNILNLLRKVTYTLMYTGGHWFVDALYEEMISSESSLDIDDTGIDEEWIRPSDLAVMCHNWDSGSALTLYVDDYPLWDEIEGRKVVVSNVNNPDVGVGGQEGLVVITSVNGVLMQDNDIMVGSIDLYRGQSMMLTYENGMVKYSMFDSPEYKNRWIGEYVQANVGSVAPIQLGDQAMVRYIDSHFKADGIGEPVFVLPEIKYYNSFLRDKILILKHFGDSSKEDIIIQVHDHAPDPDQILINSTSGQNITEFKIKPMETVVVQCAFDDPMNWNFIGRFGGSSGGGMNVDSHNADFTISSDGVYLVDGDVVITIDDTDKQFKIKMMSGTATIRALASTKIDNSIQELTLNSLSSIEIVTHQTSHWILSER